MTDSAPEVPQDPQEHQTGPVVPLSQWRKRLQDSDTAKEPTWKDNWAICQWFIEREPLYVALREESAKFGVNALNDRFFDAPKSVRERERRHVEPEDNTIESWRDIKARGHLQKYVPAIALVDEKVRLFKGDSSHQIPDPRFRHWGDVCCAPGGFSYYVMTNTPVTCTGEGITLSDEPPDDADETGDRPGHAMLLPNCDRWKYWLRDVMDRPEEIVFHGARHQCDLVIVDGNQLKARDMPVDQKTPIFQRRLSRLFELSRFVAGLQNLAEGGTMMMRLSTKVSVLSLETLITKFTYFGHVYPFVKTDELPTHLVRSTAYLVSKGFRLKKAQEDKLFDRIYDVINRLHAGEDIDDFTILDEHDPNALLEQHGHEILRILTPSWTIQHRAYVEIREENERQLALEQGIGTRWRREGPQDVRASSGGSSDSLRSEGSKSERGARRGGGVWKRGRGGWRDRVAARGGFENPGRTRNRSGSGNGGGGIPESGGGQRSHSGRGRGRARNRSGSGQSRGGFRQGASKEADGAASWRR